MPELVLVDIQNMRSFGFEPARMLSMTRANVLDNTPCRPTHIRAGGRAGGMLLSSIFGVMESGCSCMLGGSIMDQLGSTSV